ncbi:baseplate wedge subunit [Aeromonas phage GomatiRiver_11]|nr:baseplate wedge subunit [Aeromonas phage GomatiRiver_11]
MIIKAPAVTSLKINILSANQVYIKWDDVGSNFYYIVQLAQTRTGGAINWNPLGITPDNEWFEDSVIQADTYYKLRVRVSGKGFEMSDWVETEEFQTFSENAYYISTMKEFTPAASFIKEKFTLNNNNYVNFNTDVIMASLMTSDFVFSPQFTNATNIADKFVKDENYHEIQGYIEPVCLDIDRTMLGEIDGVLYLFERFQPVAKVSNDKGQNWQYYKAFNGRVGNPVSRTVIYQSSTTTYVLGYENVYYGRRANDVRWSADDVRFSSDTVTFAKTGDGLNLGFDVELFNNYARLPADMFRKGEAIAADEEYVYVAARNVMRRILTSNAPIESDPGSPNFGEKLFDPVQYQITDDPLAVVKKMDTFNGKLYAYVMGSLKTANLDPTDYKNIKLSDACGVYMFDGNTWSRVFGQTPEERRWFTIEHSNMSTNGKELFVSQVNYQFPGTLPDTELPIKDPQVIEAVKYDLSPGYNSDIKIHMGTFRITLDDDVWKLGPQQYYNEASFNWMARGGTRCWITNNNRALVVYPEIIYSKSIDDEGFASEKRVNREVHEKGKVTLYANNVTFSGFKQYANGVLFYKNTGEIIGYYEFSYRVRDNVSIFWKPDFVMLIAELRNQEREIPWTPAPTYGLRDPDLRPLVTKMMPESYLDEDTNFGAFAKYYLQFLSDGNGTYYNKLLNLIRNKYPREQYAYEYLWSEVMKRNIYLNEEKRDSVVRFFESRSSDFYSTKGVEQSYKFLFKLLYNEDVEIDIESKHGIEYDIVVESTNIDQDIVGRTIYTPTGRANVTYIERDYNQGRLRWRVTIHNMIGKFFEGQEIKSETTSFTGMILVGVRGKELLSDSIDYLNRGRSYYTMTIKSVLPASRYAQDVLRFVHPVGFGFIGITLLTMFINTGLSMKHVETIIDNLKTYRWDSGYPLEQYDRVAVLDVNGNIETDPVTGEALYAPGPNAGQPFIVPPEYDTEESAWLGKLPSERRFKMSPLFDQSAVTFANFRRLVEHRLKDDASNPRDPKVPTQVKIDE